MRQFIAIVAAVFLLFGCVSQEDGNAGSKNVQPVQGSFSVPESRLDYTATYSVIEKGTQSKKTVYRSGRNMRMDLGTENQTLFSLYILGSEGYSCTRLLGGETCYNITSSLANSGAGVLSEMPDMTDAKEAEAVGIGGMQGKCWTLPISIREERKMCFTKENITAYDEMAKDGNTTRVEYMTDLAYWVEPGDFDLPSVPQDTPQ